MIKAARAMLAGSWPANLTVRVSAPMVGKTAPLRPCKAILRLPSTSETVTRAQRPHRATSAEIAAPAGILLFDNIDYHKH
jgi:hypothetical protein